MNKTLRTIIIVLFYFIFALLIWWLITPRSVEAGEKYWICHREPQKQDISLELALPGATNHILNHADDTWGVCPDPEPEPELCDDDGALNYGQEGVCEYEPDPEPEPEPDPEPVTPEVQVISTETSRAYPVSCADGVPGDVHNIYVDTGIPNDGKLEVRWLDSDNEGATKAHIRYTDGQPGDWRYALLNTDNDGSEVIGELTNGVHYWFQVALVNGCAVGNWSDAFDPLP
jgi:hypothetical protein